MKNNFKSQEYLLKLSKVLRSNKNKLCVFGAFTTAYAATMWKSRDHSSEIFRLGLAGSFSAMICEVAFHFADTVNIRAKVMPENISSMTLMKDIYKNEGISGLSKGISSTYYGSLVMGFIYFTTYKHLKSLIYSVFGEKIHPSIVFLTSAFWAQTLSLSLYYPFNLIKCRLQTSNSTYEYKSIVHAFQTEYKRHGIRSLYKGWSYFWFMISWAMSIQFMIYESYLMHIKKYYLESYTKYELMHVIFGSFCAGAVAHALTNGLEVIVVTKQWIPDITTREIIQNEKFNLLTKGLGARVWYQSTQAVAFFSTITYVGKLFNVQFED